MVYWGFWLGCAEAEVRDCGREPIVDPLNMVLNGTGYHPEIQDVQP